MKAKHLSLSALLMMAVPVASMAADRVVHLPIEQALAEGQKSGKLDGSVKFYFAGTQPSGKLNVLKENAEVSRKTNAFGKKDPVTCAWVLQSVLISLQDQAKAAGANAVVGIVSNYDNVEYSDSQTYECHVGFLMSGVQLKGNLAKVE
ncbi:excinuclease [Dyella humicola]|uniref:excinuclease n=1 Tax=Dyella humicola TaxID=2992126 RepID=UPI002258FAB9|nr:excinuclease [Dyella humicola]